MKGTAARAVELNSLSHVRSDGRRALRLIHASILLERKRALFRSVHVPLDRLGELGRPVVVSQDDLVALQFVPTMGMLRLLTKHVSPRAAEALLVVGEVGVSSILRSSPASTMDARARAYFDAALRSRWMHVGPRGLQTKSVGQPALTLWARMLQKDVIPLPPAEMVSGAGLGHAPCSAPDLRSIAESVGETDTLGTLEQSRPKDKDGPLGHRRVCPHRRGQAADRRGRVRAIFLVH